MSIKGVKGVSFPTYSKRMRPISFNSALKTNQSACDDYVRAEYVLVLFLYILS